MMYYSFKSIWFDKKTNTIDFKRGMYYSDFSVYWYPLDNTEATVDHLKVRYAETEFIDTVLEFIKNGPRDKSQRIYTIKGK